MSGFLCRNLFNKITFIRAVLLQKKTFIRAINSTVHLNFLHNPFLKSISTSTKDSSFTVSYLTNSCGLSLETSLAAAKSLHFKTSTKPDSVLRLFKNHGFSKTQIKNLITRRPELLLYDADNILEPKIKFLKSVGLSSPKLAKIISSNPAILTRSLENQLIPSINFLKTLLHTDHNVALVLNRSISWIFSSNSVKVMAPKIEVLRSHGVSELNIRKLVLIGSEILIRSADRFNELLREIVEMGFDPSKTMFIHALRTRSQYSNASWEAKMGIYKSFGWSEEEILSAIRKQPFCMMYSEEKIRRGLDYFMNKWNCSPSVISKFLYGIGCNLEKRVIPRLSVIQVLVLKGLIKKDFSFCVVLQITEVSFLEKFVTKYKDEVPEVLKVYQGKM